jgi:S-adenosylmethionine decarboxylase
MYKIEGTHLIVDAYVQDAATLGEENMLLLFDELVEALDMTYLQRPQCVEVPLDEAKLSSGEDEGGCSYYCLITTSHIAAHTWELRKAVMLDVFSCKPFDA